MAGQSTRILFLDIDGVLRRSGSPLYRLEPDLLARFERLVRSMPDLEIVITSSWREAFSLEEIREHFAVSVAARIVGVTPLFRVDDHSRYREVLAYLKRRAGGEVTWAAVDDDPANYPPGAPVVLVDPATGLDEAAVEKLLARLG